MRCPDCNKFVSYDENFEIEVGDVEEQSDGRITCAFNVTLRCAECGTDLKQASDVEAEGQLDATTHETEDCQLAFSESDIEPDTRVEGGGRWAKTFYGARITVAVECECGAVDGSNVELVGHVQASDMDELS